MIIMMDILNVILEMYMDLEGMQIRKLVLEIYLEVVGLGTMEMMVLI